MLLPQILMALFAGLLGLCFGSFLNVCLYRWPRGEGVAFPASHCPECGHGLAWWQNLPLVSYLVLRARCHYCHGRISLRYPAVEALVGVLWGAAGWRAGQGILDPMAGAQISLYAAFLLATGLVFLWLLVALGALDLAELWLPDFLTLPGIVAGLAVFALQRWLLQALAKEALAGAGNGSTAALWQAIGARLLAVLIAGGSLWLIRWVYQRTRHREGLGLGDVKLIAMLAAWLGASRTALCFALALAIGLVCALCGMVLGKRERVAGPPLQLPLGSFLAMGGVVAYFWGRPLIAIYLRLSGWN